MSINMPDDKAIHKDDSYLFYDGTWIVDGENSPGAILDKVLNNVGGLLVKGEAAIQKELSELSKIDPGQLDQSKLLAAQVNLSRWQLASQLLSNFASGVASGLKNTVSNIGR